MKQVLIALITLVIASYCMGQCPTTFVPPPCSTTINWVERSTGGFSSYFPAGTNDTCGNLGDIYNYRDDLFNADLTRLIGYSQGQCFVVKIDPDTCATTYQCNYGLYLNDGVSSIQLQGEYIDLLTESSISTNAVIGGTGRFTAATGAADQVVVPGDDYLYRYAIHLYTEQLEPHEDSSE